MLEISAIISKIYGKNYLKLMNLIEWEKERNPFLLNKFSYYIR